MPQAALSLERQDRNIQKDEMLAAEFRVFNRLAEQMNGFHNILRSTWNELYAGTDPKSKKQPSQIIDLGLHFCEHLKAHHDIEEMHWFPILGRKMDGFRPGHFATLQHKEMHKGLDKLQPYLMSCKHKKKAFQRSEVREILDTFGGVLWKHLDDEVLELGAVSMKKYWTKEEMLRMPF